MARCLSRILESNFKAEFWQRYTSCFPNRSYDFGPTLCQLNWMCVSFPSPPCILPCWRWYETDATCLNASEYDAVCIWRVDRRVLGTRLSACTAPLTHSLARRWRAPLRSFAHSLAHAPELMAKGFWSSMWMRRCWLFIQVQLIVTRARALEASVGKELLPLPRPALSCFRKKVGIPDTAG